MENNLCVICEFGTYSQISKLEEQILHAKKNGATHVEFVVDKKLNECLDLRFYRVLTDEEALELEINNLKNELNTNSEKLKELIEQFNIKYKNNF